MRKGMKRKHPNNAWMHLFMYVVSLCSDIDSCFTAIGQINSLCNYSENSINIHRNL